jgi:hypothetical protein
MNCHPRRWQQVAIRATAPAPAVVTGATARTLLQRIQLISVPVGANG